MDTVSEALLTTNIPPIAERRFLCLWKSIMWTSAGGDGLVGTFTGSLVPPRLRAATARKLIPVTAIDLGEWGRSAMVMRIARVRGPLDDRLWAVDGDIRVDTTAASRPLRHIRGSITACDIGVDDAGTLIMRPIAM
ncbi:MULTISPECIES: hypothetical protein [unclassified Nocardia]|uniref:hypothetical protein n=1 Tax=unclassified Nocardia TaxID=2637762 RepID=UPI00278BDF39|nr:MULTISPECIES: hypothetical protein [unclassified Nocardia]